MEQAEHKTMTEEQIKQAVCEIVYDLQELRETCIERHNMIAEQIDELDMKLYNLKRHFCPEKFQVAQVSMADLNELMTKAYTSNVGQVQRMFNPHEEKNDSPA